MRDQQKCPTCGGDLIQKSRLHLFAVGACFVATLGIAAIFSVLWLPAIFISLIGLYLIAWATFGKGRWCRKCKTFKSD